VRLLRRGRSRYRRRIVDDELDVLIAGLPAIALAGPKAVGKTETASQRAATVYRLDDPGSEAGEDDDGSCVTKGGSSSNETCRACFRGISSELAR
jgi:hypothetical protein